MRIGIGTRELGSLVPNSAPIPIDGRKHDLKVSDIRLTDK